MDLRRSQMAGKVSQISRREHLNRTGGQVILGVLKFLKDLCVAIPVAYEDVVEDCSQLVNLTWNR